MQLRRETYCSAEPIQRERILHLPLCIGQLVQKAHFAEELIDYFKNTNSGNREKAYDFTRQFAMNEMNMLEHFLRSIGEWV